MNYKALKRTYEKLTKIHASTNEAVIRLEMENARLNEVVVSLDGKVKDLVKQIGIRERVSNQALERANAKNNEYLTEINRLRAEVNGDKR